ncbi:MAG: HepT-like ribonuclease domain-containing protein [Bryobacteraceae bacterium]
MPFSDPSIPLQDIAEAIERIEEFTHGMDFEAFRSDAKTVAAVERKLQIISEAAVRLGNHGEALCPGLPWSDIRGIGNWLRHRYDRVDLEIIWQTVNSKLPPLHAAARKALE